MNDDADLLPRWARDQRIERARVRRALLVTLQDMGLSVEELREAVGASRQRVHQLLRKASEEGGRFGHEWRAREAREALERAGVL